MNLDVFGEKAQARENTHMNNIPNLFININCNAEPFSRFNV